jgi:2-hydroxychromene-2-carboxylate isomerase
MAHIDYYLATVSPNVYLAGTRLEEVAARHGATITYKPVDIMALFARTGGVAVGERHPSRQEYRLQEMRRQAAKAGLPINLKPAFWPTNPAPSSYAIIAAQTAGGGDLGALVHAITRACWAEERNIAEDEVVRDCLSEAGFDPKLADAGLLQGAETYARNLEDAVSAGVFGAPFYIVTDSDERFWGQDRIADLDAYLAGTL